MKLQMKKKFKEEKSLSHSSTEGKIFKFLFNNNTTIHISRLERNLAHKIPQSILLYFYYNIQYIT